MTETGQHVVDTLIEERAPRLMTRPRLWSATRAVAYPLLGYRKAVGLADTIAPMGGEEALDWVRGFLDLDVRTSGLEAIPERGGCVVMANHPGGIADGVAVWDALRARRPDLCYFANRDALRVCPGLEDVVLPVDWRKDTRSRERSRETVRAALTAFQQERCVVIFPAGRMAEWNWRRWRLTEKPWQVTAISFARRFGFPVIPMGVTQRMPFLYYALAQMSEELKDMTVFHGFMGKKRARYRLSFGEAIDPKTLPASEAEATETVRLACEKLAWD
ncbi:1-acyl-sn-glycerol-3-phosphate acyltransferase [Hyphobacterium marinum]|uniref:1-acyl-sn-glycerol-3-phosphate acyltransferase n=1 Tax=Hyphobacterium marinum TaxID=3116574 RepID=A0ABU7LVH7_9PROT|nr:1-acyl-sn-glycerol-3-phosphate acyltransferase [Hyphobacterium sp. Y6023]MEE2565564.1 1-acyl-sn-glycerol-3-phosphate acyltransferase [Hyphobacterium sp. Y6023]